MWLFFVWTRTGTKVKPGQKDLTGQRFGRLVCLEPSSQRDKQGGTQWLCQCDCGKQCLAATHQLLCGYKKSCGCLSHPPLKDYVGKRFGMLTVLEYAGKRLLKNNSSGYNGVYLNRRTQKWTAQIGFKGKNYNLGSFSRIEDAVDARKKAEDRIYGEFLEWYYQTYQKKPVHATNSSKTET